MNRYSIEGSQAEDPTVSDGMFGTNYLFHRQDLENFVELAEKFDLSSARYPGGSITEHFFDINNPDIVPESFDEISEENFTGLSNFLEACNQSGVNPVIVLPTRVALQSNGEVDPQYISDLQSFVSNLVDRCGAGAEFENISISSFEIGNEYWGSGQLRSEDYGMIADKMIIAVRNAISTSALRGDQEPSILVQMGNPVRNGPDFDEGGAFDTLTPQSSNYKGVELNSSDFTTDGQVRWSSKINVTNELIISQLSPEARAEIDGLVEHYYYTLNDEANSDLETNSHSLSYIDEKLAIWRENGLEQPLHITEWNVHDQNYDNLGLAGAGTMVFQFTNMVELGVEAAHFWPLQHNTSNDLSGHFDEEPEMSPLGGSYYLLSKFAKGSSLHLKDFSDEDFGVVQFGNEQSITSFLMSRSSVNQEIELDVSHLSGFKGEVEIHRLTVHSDQEHWVRGEGFVEVPEYLDNDAIAKIDYSLKNIDSSGTISINLAPYEVVTLTLTKEEDEHEEDPKHLTSRIVGTDGDDVFFGSNENDEFVTRYGDDFVDGGAGDDTIWTGAGFDEVAAGDGDDKVGCGANADLAHGGGGNDTIWAADGMDTITGGAGNDLIFGGRHRDEIWGGDDDDNIYGGHGDDQIGGGLGEDFVLGGQGKDTLWGGGGNDTIYGGVSHDKIVGDVGNDKLFGNEGQDEIWGGSGDDSLWGGWGDDYLSGGDGADTLVAGMGSDTLIGGGGGDLFSFSSPFISATIRDFSIDDGDSIEFSRELLSSDLRDAEIRDILEFVKEPNGIDKLILDFGGGIGVIRFEGLEDEDEIEECIDFI